MDRGTSELKKMEFPYSSDGSSEMYSELCNSFFFQVHWLQRTVLDSEEKGEDLAPTPFLLAIHQY